MELEILARKALDILKSKFDLPKSGFLAGGSLANTIWELKSGNKAVINDIDIFIFDGKIEDINDINKEESLYKYKDDDIKYYEDYTGMCWDSYTKDFYTITSSEKDGILNIIKYKGSNDTKDLVLSSFDINATGVGYSIEDDKFYWTPDFEDFIKNGQLKISNIKTPAHSAIRIVKKSKELNVNLDEFEIKLISYCLTRQFQDLNKLRFKKRYFDLFNMNKECLEKYFEIRRDYDIEEFLRIQLNVNTELYFLHTNNYFTKDIDGTSKDEDPFLFLLDNKYIFDDENLSKIYTSTDFMFYMRNIYNTKFKDIWSKIYFFYTDSKYIDVDISKEDLELLSKLGSFAPNSIENLKGMKISEQLHIVKKLLDIYKDDPIVAISILEKGKLSLCDDLDDESNQLLLELSVRRNIINDTKGKVSKILDIKPF